MTGHLPAGWTWQRLRAGSGAADTLVTPDGSWHVVHAGKRWQVIRCAATARTAADGTPELGYHRRAHEARRQAEAAAMIAAAQRLVRPALQETAP